MFVRAELHNHSNHSDGRMTVEELISYAVEKEFEVLALTDHNTVSGHSCAFEEIQRRGYPLSLLPGVEITTFYGHILALGLTRMVDFTSLDPNCPELFFQALRDGGAKALGIAHPFDLDSPIMNGCRFKMKVKDWSFVDYIEVDNSFFMESSFEQSASAFALFENEQALMLWERLVLSGRKIAAVTGKDIHTRPVDAPVFTTYVQIEKHFGSSQNDAVIEAILTQKTIVTKGPLFETQLEDGKLKVIFDNSSSYLDWNRNYGGRTFLLELHDSAGSIRYVETDLCSPVVFSWAENVESGVIKLYEGERDYKHLLTVGAPVFQYPNKSVD